MAKKEYQSPTVEVKKERKSYSSPKVTFYDKKSDTSSFKENFLGVEAVGQIFLPFLAIILVFRFLMTGEVQSVSFYEILNYIADYQPDMTFLNFVLRNFETVSNWISVDSSGIIEFFTSIGVFFGQCFNVVAFVAALLWNAIQVIVFVFGLLFVVM